MMIGIGITLVGGGRVGPPAAAIYDDLLEGYPYDEMLGGRYITEDM